MGVGEEGWGMGNGVFTVLTLHPLNLTPQTMYNGGRYGK